MVFRLYTTLELKAEAERQATWLWEEGFEFAPAVIGDAGGGWGESSDYKL